MEKVDIWWTSLKVTEKERVAAKIAGKSVLYPECTDVWAALPEDRKAKIYEHCKDRHGLELQAWLDGKPYGD